MKKKKIKKCPLVSKKGDKVLIDGDKGELRIRSSVDLVEKLAGSIKVPSRFKGLSEDEIIAKAKEECFSKKCK